MIFFIIVYIEGDYSERLIHFEYQIHEKPHSGDASSAFLDSPQTKMISILGPVVIFVFSQRASNEEVLITKMLQG